MMTTPRILYVYTGNRTRRIAECENGTAPDEFFYGYFYSVHEGYETSIAETDECDGSSRSFLGRLLQKQNMFHMRHFAMGVRANHAMVLRKILCASDIIVAVPDSVALGIATMRALRMIRTPLVYCAMGFAAALDQLRITRPIFYKVLHPYIAWLLRHCAVIVVVGEAEAAFFKKEFPMLGSRICFIPFGVDLNFWQYRKKKVRTNKIVFVGNDRNRDFDCVQAIAQALPQYSFIFVSRAFKDKKLPPNVLCYDGAWGHEALSDSKIRDLYYSADVVINPLKNSIQPSGQSVTLQSMACGTPVLITRTQGFWDVSKFEDKKHLVFLGSNDVREWVSAIAMVMKNNALYDELCMRGSELVRETYSSRQFASHLHERIEKIWPHN